MKLLRQIKFVFEEYPDGSVFGRILVDNKDVYSESGDSLAEVQGLLIERVSHLSRAHQEAEVKS